MVALSSTSRVRRGGRAAGHGVATISLVLIAIVVIALFSMNLYMASPSADYGSYYGTRVVRSFRQPVVRFPYLIAKLNNRTVSMLLKTLGVYGKHIFTLIVNNSYLSLISVGEASGDKPLLYGVLWVDGGGRVIVRGVWRLRVELTGSWESKESVFKAWRAEARSFTQFRDYEVLWPKELGYASTLSHYTHVVYHKVCNWYWQSTGDKLYGVCAYGVFYILYGEAVVYIDDRSYSGAYSPRVSECSFTHNKSGVGGEFGEVSAGGLAALSDCPVTARYRATAKAMVNCWLETGRLSHGTSWVTVGCGCLDPPW